MKSILLLLPFAVGGSPMRRRTRDREFCVTVHSPPNTEFTARRPPAASLTIMSTRQLTWLARGGKEAVSRLIHPAHTTAQWCRAQELSLHATALPRIRPGNWPALMLQPWCGLSRSIVRVIKRAGSGQAVISTGRRLRGTGGTSGRLQGGSRLAQSRELSVYVIRELQLPRHTLWLAGFMFCTLLKQCLDLF